MAEVKIETFTDLLTDMSEKVGESKVDTTDPRKRMINNAINYISNGDLWWFDEGSDANTTTTTALNYTLPTDYRVPHPINPLRIGSGDWRIMIPFRDLQLHEGASGIVQLPQHQSKKRVYIYANEINFIQSSMTAGQTITHFYYKAPALLDAGGDTPNIPIQYREAISLLAAGNLLKSQGGKESVEGNDLLSLYDQQIVKMRVEDDNRRNYGVKRRALDPEEQSVLDQ